MSAHKPTVAELLAQLQQAVTEGQPAANDDAITEEDERELQKLADESAARMKRARNG